MNFDCLFQKHKLLNSMYEKYGSFLNLQTPEEYAQIWNRVNLDVQNKKLDTSQIYDPTERKNILDGLSKRAYYLCLLAEENQSNRIAEVGTAQGYQYFSFCHYADLHDAKVFSCDPRDVRNEHYKQKFENLKNIGTFVKGTSADMSKVAKNIDFFYIDGLHDLGEVSRDVQNLLTTQNPNKIPVWVFDDFDTRFGCAQDIWKLCLASRSFKVVKIGKTASGQPSHQVILFARFEV